MLEVYPENRAATLSYAQQLLISCVADLSLDSPVAEDGVREGLHYYSHSLSDKARRLCLVASVVYVDRSDQTYILALYKLPDAGSTLDDAKFVESVGVELHTSESIRSVGVEEPGTVCTDDKLVNFIAGNGILPMMAERGLFAVQSNG